MVVDILLVSSPNLEERMYQTWGSIAGPPATSNYKVFYSKVGKSYHNQSPIYMIHPIGNILHKNVPSSVTTAVQEFLKHM